MCWKVGQETLYIPDGFMANRTVTENDVKCKTLSALGRIRLGEMPKATVE